MKNFLRLLFAFFSILFSNAQTPVSFYPSIDPIVQNFGSKIDLDNNEILVSNGRSVVYLFEKNDNGLQQKQIINSPNSSDGAFGYSISIQNNFIVVGDPLIDSVSPNSGSVFIYNKTATSYELQQIIPSPEAVTNYHFGSCVKVFGNKLFISSENKVFGQSASSNIGSVYCYLFNGSEWVFQQKIIGIESNFGKKILVNDPILLIEAQSNSIYYVKIYKLDIDNNYYFAGTLGYGNEFSPFDFSLDGNSLHILYGGSVANIIFNENGSFSNNDAAYLTLPQSDQISGSIAVSGDNLFIGSTGYILQVVRNFPVLHYKKTGNTWTYQTTYFGTGPTEDDYFGSVLANKGNLLIIGAPEERVQGLTQGNAYYLDYTLGTSNFEKKQSNLYPNPTRDLVLIKNDSLVDIVKTEVYTVTGSLLSTDQNPNQVSLEKYTQGLYFVKIYYQNNTEDTFKIIKN